ncbi:MAG: phosphomethylpyrimidine synthase [Candidatus Omnitrophota bacterium]|nr:MAG: phosphomethylpyrimidine synthase [Candidatus Omnitrophota bacterium]
MTQLEFAKKNIKTVLMKKIASQEGCSEKFILRGIKQGKIVIPANKKHRIKKPCAIGKGLRIKVNANIGTSTDRSQLNDELAKLKASIASGADTVMDLSVGGNLKKIRNAILRLSEVPVGTVPIYEVAINAQRKTGDFSSFSVDDLFNVLENQAKEGIDFFTVHAGVTKACLKILKKQRRLLNMVSRGGVIMANWMSRHKKENPLYEYFDRLLEIAYRYDVTLSLGDGLRPGSILDATDQPQIAELRVLGELARRSRKKNVQVMIEGPGHIPLNQIEKNISLEKKICGEAPFYVLGPLVTDIAPGYDHITSAIGGALAASYGADFLCYVTPSEHLRHPSIKDVKEGVISSRIAAHAADIAKGSKSAIARDKEISSARRKRDWQEQIAKSIDPDKARSYRLFSKPHLKDVCTMCGNYCSIKLMEECLLRV